MTTMEELFKRAEKEKLWFYGRYHDLWFSPERLRQEQLSGSFRWGPSNWELRDPREQVSYLRQRAQRLHAEADKMEQELGS